MRVETVMFAPDTEQYAGKGQPTVDLTSIATAARRTEEFGFDGLTAPEAGHDPFLPLVLAAEHTEKITLGTNVTKLPLRSPLLMAKTVGSAAAMFPGRIEIGVGRARDTIRVLTGVHERPLQRE